jgi:tRNA pseudouridine-54 N-methylase
VVFHAVLNGPSSPPLHLQIEGAYLHNVRTDVNTWQNILKKVIGGGAHPGIVTSKRGFEVILRAKSERACIYVLEEGGKDISETELATNSVFVLGDHVGLPKKAENFALKYGEKISLSKQAYLAASCITVLNHLLDRQTSNLS